MTYFDDPDRDILHRHQNSGGRRRVNPLPHPGSRGRIHPLPRPLYRAADLKTPHEDPTTLAKKKLVIAALEDIKARDIQAIDVRKVTAIFDWIIVASAESAPPDQVARAPRARRAEGGAAAAIVGTEGEESGDWMLVDAGDVVAHVMQPAVRQYYNLEELWGEGKFDEVVNSSVPVPPPRARRAPAKAAGAAKAKAKAKRAARKPRPAQAHAKARRHGTAKPPPRRSPSASAPA